jgi:hypothetical protein
MNQGHISDIHHGRHYVYRLNSIDFFYRASVDIVDSQVDYIHNDLCITTFIDPDEMLKVADRIL